MINNLLKNYEFLTIYLDEAIRIVIDLEDFKDLH